MTEVLPRGTRLARTTTGLLLSCHPGPVLAVTAGVTALAWSAGRGPAGTAWSGIAVLTGQLSIGFSNDYMDRAADLAAGRRDKPVAAGRVPARLVAAAAVVTFAGSAAVSMASGWRAGLAQLATVAAGWVYNLGLKRTMWSVVPFIPGFGLFPAFVTLGLPGHPWPAWWATTAGALLGMGAHFANVLPDLPADLATGVRGLPQRLGGRLSRIFAGVLLGAATGVLALAPEGAGAMPAWLRWAGVAVAVVVAGTGVVSAVAGSRGAKAAPPADAPRADAPRADAPRADAPRADAPRADTPRADTPRADALRADAPGAAASAGAAGTAAGGPGPAARYLAMLAVIGAALFDVVLLVARGGHMT